VVVVLGKYWRVKSSHKKREQCKRAHYNRKPVYQTGPRPKLGQATIMVTQMFCEHSAMCNLLAW
jgi:hypothetical protein